MDEIKQHEIMTRLNIIKSTEPELFDNMMEVLEKAKYYKREPKAGGGYRYYYTKEQYNKDKGVKEETVQKVTDTFKLPEGTTTSKLDELDAELSRAGIYGDPDFNNMTIKITDAPYEKVKEIMSKHNASPKKNNSVWKETMRVAKEKYGAGKQSPGSNKEGIDAAIKEIKDIYGGTNINITESSNMAKAYSKMFNIEPERAAALINKYSK